MECELHTCSNIYSYRLSCSVSDASSWRTHRVVCWRIGSDKQIPWTFGTFVKTLTLKGLL